MQGAFLSTLSLLMVTNSTIKSHGLLKNSYEMDLSILPRSFKSTITFQNFLFKKINLIHFSPVTFDGCLFGSPSVFIESRELLIIRNCFNLSGSIEAIDRGILVDSTSLSQSFKHFYLFNSQGAFQNSTFTTKSDKPVITVSKSKISIKGCNFSNCKHGGIVALQNTNLTVLDSIFFNMEAEEGPAINFIGNSLIISESSFEQCKALRAGGALKIVANLNSTLTGCFFYNNKSPQGKSIYISENSYLSIVDCFIPSSANEIYTPGKSNLFVKDIGDGIIGNNESPTPYFSPSGSFSSSLGFSPSTIFTRSKDFSATRTYSATNEFSPSITLTEGPNVVPSASNGQSSSSPQSSSSNASPVVAKDKRGTKYLTFVIIICVVVVVIAIVAVTAILLQKRKSQIYPSDYDGETEEPKKTTVVISNINDDDL
ncbi:hypothetical protein M9Y10_029250 [Tritrichomonas musculus]|uniref:Right handed beta helix domain-containing protein n=1 Tax=Tritrichomonas musculus TaxID=1915356 RepID=A0ABR2KLJ9_9EUKA